MTGSCYEAKEVGTVSDEQIETRSSQRRTYKTRARSQSRPMTSDSKSQLSRARLVRAPRVSKKDRVQEERVLPKFQNLSQDAVTECEKSVAVRGRRIPKKVPATPVVTPSSQVFRGSARKSPRPSGNGPGAPHSSDKGMVYCNYCSMNDDIYTIFTLLLLPQEKNMNNVVLKASNLVRARCCS